MNFFKKISDEVFESGKNLDEIKAVADRCTILRKGVYIDTVDVASTTKEELSEMHKKLKME